MSEGSRAVAEPALREQVGQGSLVSLLAWRAVEAPTDPFLRVGEQDARDFGSLASAAATLAEQLRAAGVGPGARVLVRIGNDERFLPALAATWLLGAAVVPMHPGAVASEVARVIEALEIDAAVVDADDAARTSIGRPVCVIDRIATPRADGPVHLDVPDVAGTDAALVLLTSGSTGQPKGVVLTHDNAWSNLRQTVSAFRRDTGPGESQVAERPPNLIANPLSHTAGIVRLLFALYVGRGVVLLPKFDAQLARRVVVEHGIDGLTLNPSMLRMLLDDLEPGQDLGRVRYASSGTAPLTPALREEFEVRFGIPVLQAYGQTEAFGGIAIESVRDVLAGNRRPGSVGRPLPGVELRLVNEAGAEVGAGEVGEIVVRSASSTRGYAGSDDSPVDADGWLRTGDLGRLDEDGYLYITGRLKNIIICGGFNVTPDEVEAALEENAAVEEAVVVSAPDEKLGEITIAVVVAREDAEAIAADVAPRLAPYKRPRRVLVIASLPRVPNGKVDRDAVTSWAHEQLGLADPPTQVRSLSGDAR